MKIRLNFVIFVSVLTRDFDKWRDAIEEAAQMERLDTAAVANFEVHHADGKVEALSGVESRAIVLDRALATRSSEDLWIWAKTARQIRDRFGKENWR